MLAKASIHEKPRARLWPAVDPGLRQDDDVRLILRLAIK